MTSRPATYADFFGLVNPETPRSTHVGESITRHNVEFGAKKFIKP